MNGVLWGGLALVVLARLVWVADYFRVAGRRSFRLLTSSLYDAPDDQARREIHQSVAAVTEGLLDNCLIVGALALAAWTALFAVARQAPGDELTPTTRALLLLGASVLICAPVVFRKPDRHLSYIGRCSAMFIGLQAVGLSLASIAYNLIGGRPGTALALVLVIVLVVRDIADTGRAIRQLHSLLQPRINLMNQLAAAQPAEPQAEGGS